MTATRMVRASDEVREMVIAGTESIDQEDEEGSWLVAAPPADGFPRGNEAVHEGEVEQDVLRFCPCLCDGQARFRIAGVSGRRTGPMPRIDPLTSRDCCWSLLRV